MADHDRVPTMSGPQNFKLSPAQVKVLKAVARGEVVKAHYMGWFQKGGWRMRGDRNPNPATMEKLLKMGLIRQLPGEYGRPTSDVVLTDIGKALVESKGGA